MIVVFGIFSTARSDEAIQYSNDNGFVFYYQMPSDDADTCDLNSVKWNKPFVRVWLMDVAGGANDAVQIGEHKTNNLYNIEEISTQFNRLKLKNKDLTQEEVEAKRYKIDYKALKAGDKNTLSQRFNDASFFMVI